MPSTRGLDPLVVCAAQGGSWPLAELSACEVLPLTRAQPPNCCPAALPCRRSGGAHPGALLSKPLHNARCR